MTFKPIGRRLLAAAAILCAIAAPAWAANVRVADLPTASSLSDSDLLIVDQSNQTRKATGTQVKAYVKSGFVDDDITDASTLGKQLLEAADQSTAQSILGVTGISDPEVVAIAGLTSAADKGIYFTGSGTAATYDLSSFSRTVLDDTSASAMRSTLGLGTAATASTGTSGAVLCLLNQSCTWSGAQIIQGNVLVSSSASGSSAGPDVTIARSNLTPAVNDAIGRLLFQGNNATPTGVYYGALRGYITDTTAGSEDGKFCVAAMVNGTLFDRFCAGLGLFYNGQSDPGAGKINALGYQISGTDLQATANTWSAQQTFSGGIKVSGSVPAASSCGTSPAVASNSNDAAGKVTVGSSASGACTITFAASKTNAPFCNVVNASGAALTYDVSTTAITVSAGASSSNVLRYACFQN